jgi:ABC-type multidrug transport system fused ATPase/permease subunit
VVQQDPVLFGGTIHENIAYGHPNASREDVVRAAKIAHCGFILDMPEGYDTVSKLCRSDHMNATDDV